MNGSFVARIASRSLLVRVAVCVPLGLAAWLTGAGEIAQQAAAAQAIYLPEPTEPPAPKVVGPRKVVEKYADGSTRVERETLVLSDEQIINHGAYVEFYPNGQKFAEGRYHQGVYDGVWSFWHDNGQLCKQVTFDKGIPNGSWDVYRADGTLMGSQQYVEGRRTGVWRHYFDDGKTLKLEQTYGEGDLGQEKRTTYFANGKPRQSAELVQGRLEGKVIEWDEAGRKRSEFTLLDGKLHGELKRWDQQGNEAVQYYENGKRIVRPAS
jgi:antitoxin component YwqK of YwqJK toxin-antitoxin module